MQNAERAADVPCPSARVSALWRPCVSLCFRLRLSDCRLMRILIISDVHANYRGLLAVLNRFGDADEVWCLGDIVEYGPCPTECIGLVRERCDRVIAGNHDVSFVAGDRGWARYDRHTVSDGDAAWLAGLPHSLTAEVDGQSMRLVHGTPTDPLNGKLYPKQGTGSGSPAPNPSATGPPGPTSPGNGVEATRPTDSPDAYRSGLANCAADAILSGHTHVAMVEHCYGKAIVNTGTVGQPRDADPRAQCMIYEDVAFRFVRVEYDLDALALDYERSSLPDDVKRTWIDYTRRGVVDVHGVQLGPFSQ